MALSSGCLVTSVISTRAVKGDPDCSKTKLTVRLHPREYFPAFYASRRACVIHFWILEGAVGRLVLSSCYYNFNPCGIFENMTSFTLILKEELEQGKLMAALNSWK